jgi:uncharacterized membrane protein YeaQ/YmgE (transglycosylase-associated protein family)
MDFLLWFLALGAIGGWLGGKLMIGRSHGQILDVFMGFGGAVVVGIWTDSLGRLGLWGFVFASVSALLGALMLTVLTAFMNGRKYA